MSISTDTIAEFRTLGGALVRLHHAEFKSTWGEQYGGTSQYTTSGTQWVCQGCGALGCPPGAPFPRGYLSSEFKTARKDANDHAASCRSIPRPDGDTR